MQLSDSPELNTGIEELKQINKSVDHNRDQMIAYLIFLKEDLLFKCMSRCAHMIVTQNIFASKVTGNSNPKWKDVELPPSVEQKWEKDLKALTLDEFPSAPSTMPSPISTPSTITSTPSLLSTSQHPSQSKLTSNSQSSKLPIPTQLPTVKWDIYYNDDNIPYWYNPQTQETTWNDPKA